MAEDPAGPETLTRLLRAVGIDEDEFTRALERGLLDAELLIAERVALPHPRTLTSRDAWEQAGVDEPTARALWRAMGFPDIPDDECELTEADVDALRTAADMLRRSRLPREVALQQTRTMSRAMSRIASAQQDVIAARIGSAGPEGQLEETLELAEATMPALDVLLVYIYRRHLASATRRTVLLRHGLEEAEGRVTVGFADLVGFTSLSQKLGDDELGTLIDEFTATATDLVGGEGARVVKMIGDEVMFSADDTAAAARIALGLSAAYDGVVDAPGIRVGLATGSVIDLGGDVYGPTVNLASRLTGMARPGTVLVDEATADDLAEDESFSIKPVRAQKLKGLGRTRSYRLRLA